METNNAIPLVSVIMPAYNAALFIEEAIASVRAQTVTDWELFVIDDCSTDDTYKIACDIAMSDKRITVLKNEENMGVAKTRNRGIDLSNGKFIAFLDSDDYWKHNMLERMIQRADETDADIIYCSYEIVSECGVKLCNDFIVPEKTSFKESIVRSVITCSTVLITKQLAGNIHFPTDMYHEDIALWFGLLKEGKIARGVTDVLASYRQRANSRSSDKLRSARRRWFVYRKYLNMPFFQSVITMINYGVYGLKKYKKIQKRNKNL